MIRLYVLKKTTINQTNSSNAINSSSIDGIITKIYEFAAQMAKNKEDPEKRRVFLIYIIINSYNLKNLLKKLKRGIVANFYPKIQRDLLKKNAIEQVFI